MKKLIALLIVGTTLIAWDTPISTKEFAVKYTDALAKHDTTELKKFIQPANYIPFYAKRFSDIKVLETKDINDTLSSFTFSSNKGIIHTPVLKKDGKMFAQLNLKYAKDIWSYTNGIYTSDNSNLNKGVLSYDMTRFEIAGLTEKKLNKERDSYNVSISSVESVSNLKLKNELGTELRM